LIQIRTTFSPDIQKKLRNNNNSAVMSVSLKWIRLVVDTDDSCTKNDDED